MNAIIYARVSTKEQKKGYSLEAQVESCQNAADRDGVKIDKIFQEAESASKVGRSGFAEMAKYIDSNNGVIVYCEKVDRLHRNYSDMALISMMIQEGKCEIRFVREAFRLHEDSPPGDWMNFGMNGVIADNYARNLSREVKKGQRKRFENGWKVCGRVPLGFEIEPKTRHIIHDEEKAPLVKKLFEFAATGNFSLVELQSLALEWGLVHNTAKRLSSTIHRMLHNPFYYGWLKSETLGEKMGAHEPIVSKKLWDEVQTKLAQRNKASTKRRTHTFIFTGAMRCECGEAIVGMLAKKRYVYYNCRNRCYKFTREWDLEDQFEEAIAKLTVPRELFEIAVNELKGERANFSKTQKDTIADVKRRISKIETKIAKLVDEKLEGRIDEKAYEVAFSRFEGEMETLKIHEADLKSEAPPDFSEAENLFKLLEEPVAVYQALNTGGKNEFVKMVCSNSILKNGTLTPTYRKPFDRIAEGRDCQTMLGWLDKVRTYLISFEGRFPDFGVRQTA